MRKKQNISHLLSAINRFITAILSLVLFLSGCSIHFTKIPYRKLTSGAILPHDLKIKFHDSQSVIIHKENQWEVFEQSVVLMESNEESHTMTISISSPNDTINTPLLATVGMSNNNPPLYLAERKKHVTRRLYYIIKNEASIYIRDKESYRYKKDYASIWLDKEGYIINNYSNGYKEIAIIGLDRRGNVYVKCKGEKTIVNKENFQSVFNSIIND